MTANTTPTLNPQVLWSQRTDTITLVVNLQDVTNETIDLTSKSLEFTGTSADKVYHFKLDFYKDVSVEVSYILLNVF
jgi:hypothetical protein